MTQMTLERPAATRFSEVPQHRFYTTESPLPAKPGMDNCCPHCHHSLVDDHPHTIQRLTAGVRQLFAAVLIIVMSVLRLARLIVAMAFSLVGLFGFGLHNVGQRIVHPNDRRLLPPRGRHTGDAR